MKPEPFEIVPGLSYEEYEKRPGTNGSLLAAVIKKSMRSVRAIIDGKGKAASEAMDFGTAFHALALEGRREFVEQPETYPAKDGPKPWNNNANFCKEWNEKQDKTILTGEEIEQLIGMTDAVKSEKILAPYLSGQSELSIFATQNGYPLKIRIDHLPDDESGPVIDFKKARSAKPDEFVKSAYDLLYHVKAAFYLDVLKLIGKPRKSFWFVAVEQTYPHDTSIIRMCDRPGDLFIPAGRTLYRDAFKELVKAQNGNLWPSYGQHEAEVAAPDWMKNQLDNLSNQ